MSRDFAMIADFLIAAASNTSQQAVKACAPNDIMVGFSSREALPHVAATFDVDDVRRQPQQRRAFDADAVHAPRFLRESFVCAACAASATVAAAGSASALGD